MTVINLQNNNPKNFIEIFNKWLEKDIVKINSVISENLVSSATLISELSNHIINSGGKRIRPLLTVACSKLCNYTGR